MYAIRISINAILAVKNAFEVKRRWEEVREGGGGGGGGWRMWRKILFFEDMRLVTLQKYKKTNTNLNR